MLEGDLALATEVRQQPGCTIHVCTTCRRQREDLPEGYDQPGIGLAAVLDERLAGSGIAVIVPCPISDPGETRVTAPSAAIRIQALGAKLAAWASAFFSPPAPPNATATPMPPALTRNARRDKP